MDRRRVFNLSILPHTSGKRVRFPSRRIASNRSRKSSLAPKLLTLKPLWARDGSARGCSTDRTVASKPAGRACILLTSRWAAGLRKTCRPIFHFSMGWLWNVLGAIRSAATFFTKEPFRLEQNRRSNKSLTETFLPHPDRFRA